MMLTIKIIPFGSQEYINEVALRYTILREPLGLSFSEEQLESEIDEIHINAFDKNLLVGTLVLKIVSIDEIKMRQVAVLPELRGKGIGKCMVFFSEGWAKGRGYKLMSMSARKDSVPFYIGLGYRIVGDEFIEVTIPHFRMEKTL